MLVFQNSHSEEKKTTLKGLIVIHSATPKAFYLVMDVQPFYKSENKWSLVGVSIFFTVYFWNNTQHALNYQKSAKKIHCPFSQPFLLLILML